MQKKKKLIVGLSVLGSLAIATAVVSGAVCTSINQKQSTSDVSNLSQASSINSTSTTNASATTINNSIGGTIQLEELQMARLH